MAVQLRRLSGQSSMPHPWFPQGNASCAVFRCLPNGLLCYSARVTYLGEQFIGLTVEGGLKGEVGGGPGGADLRPSLSGASLGFTWGKAGLLGPEPQYLFLFKGLRGATSFIYRRQKVCAQDHSSVGAPGMAAVESFRSCQIVPRQPNHQAVGRPV